MVGRNIFTEFKRGISGITLAGILALSGCPGPTEPKPKPNPNPEQQPSISLTAQRIGDTGIGWDADLINLTQANLDVARDGSDVPGMSRTITPSNSSGTYNDQRKGNYSLTATGGGVSKNSTVTIPNFKPQGNFTSLENSAKQNSQIIWNFESMLSDADKNHEDNPVSLVSVTSLGEMIQINVNEYEISLNSGNISGEELIEIAYGSQDGMFGIDTVSFNIEPLVLARISGRIENNRTDLGESSQMNVYNGSVSQENFLGHINASDGTFDFQLNEEVEGPLILRTQLNQNSYVRTISIPTTDTLGLIIRSHPKDQPYDLRLHMEEMNSGFFKWNLENLEGVEIFDNDPLGRGSFTREEQDFVETNFRANLECYTGNHPTVSNLYIQKDNADSKRHDLEDNGRDWIFITRDTTLALEFSGVANTLIEGEGIIYKSVIKIRNSPNLPTMYVTSHEKGHAWIAPSGHSQTLSSPLTNMELSSSLPDQPGPADCEAGTVLYDDTYTAESSYDNILGEPSTFDTSLSGTPGITIR
jgi:hypothetical protein